MDLTDIKNIDAKVLDGLSIDQIVNIAQPFKYITVSSDFTCQHKYYYSVDTSSNSITATLPSNPNNFDVIGFVDLKGTFDTNNLIIAIPSGVSYTIMGLQEDMIVDVKNASFELIYYNGDWRVK